MRSRFLAPAKINLALHVTGQRADGYHLLDSIVGFCGPWDLIEVDLADDTRLEITGPFSAFLKEATDENLILWAARALEKHARDKAFPTRIRLQKNLPIAAGLGGGSSDAAATLQALNQLWKINLSDQKLADIGLTLGADLPVTLHKMSARMRGIGDDVLSLDQMPGFPILLINSGDALATSAVFAHVKNKDNPPLGPIPQTDDKSVWLAYLNGCRNDLEEAAFEICPGLSELLIELRDIEGCALARMSGSGATCFALFDNSDDCHRAATQMRQSHPGYWIEESCTGTV